MPRLTFAQEAQAIANGLGKPLHLGQGRDEAGRFTEGRPQTFRPVRKTPAPAPRWRLEWSQDGATWSAVGSGDDAAALMQDGLSLTVNAQLGRAGIRGTCVVRILDECDRIAWVYIRGEEGQVEELVTADRCDFCGGYGWRGVPDETCPACDGVGTAPLLPRSVL